MLEPYEGQPDNTGRTYYEPDEFADLDHRAATQPASSCSCTRPATGGSAPCSTRCRRRAARNGPRDARHQVVHVEFPTLPTWAGSPSWAWWPASAATLHPDIAGPGHDWAEAVGERRWARAWPMRSLHETGATLAFSSDWNVAEMDPLLGLYSAVTRRGLGGGPAWMPEETVDLATAVRAYTWGGAFANFCESDRGTVTVGKHADLVLLSHDLFATPVDAIPGITVDLTLLAGAVAHRR